MPVAFARAVVDELANPLTPVLAGGAMLSFAVGSVVDAGMVIAVISGNAVVGGLQRLRVDRALARLERTERRTVVTRRGGAEGPVDAAELVPGDVVHLRAGEAVPADCRILTRSLLEVDESSLTGESMPVRKGVDPVRAPIVAERSSMLYANTSIAAGDAEAVVVATGHDTEARRGLALAVHAPDTGVEARLRSLTGTLVRASLVSGAALVGSGLLRGIPLRDTLGAGVSLAVAAVPEGLPMLSTVAQLGAAHRISKHGALVHNARAIEALGRVDVVCADKTGTLTAGEITLRMVSDGTSDVPVEGMDAHHASILAAALRAGPATSRRAYFAHPTDRAFFDGATRAGVDETTGLESWRRGRELPFEPRRGYHATLGATASGRQLFVKGAPEVVLPRCLALAGRDGEVVLDDSTRAGVDEAVDRLARKGLRVLAVARRDADDQESLHDRDVADLTFMGLVGLGDPARPTSTAAIADLRRAGVRVIMITGDHPSTAAGVAAELGLLDDDGGKVLTGGELDGMSEKQLRQAVSNVAVFARVTPAHKVHIVRALQQSGRVVAMTGDGANDAAAIRLADVGIALGQRSTSAAREAADLVVTDERIETIVEAVLEGRAMWTSVRDAVALLVGGNLGEIAFTLTGALLTGRSPLNARQLLLVNLMTDGLPALALALRRPRNMAVERLVDEGPDASLGRPLRDAIIVRAVATASGAGVAYVAARLTGRPARAGTVGLVALTGAQLGQTLAAGGRDPVVAIAGIGSTAVLVGIVQTPGLSQLFGCTPIGPVGWTIGLSAAAGATLGSVLVPRVLEAMRSTPDISG
jgi:cation-transporting ATPase I